MHLGEWHVGISRWNRVPVAGLRLWLGWFFPDLRAFPVAVDWDKQGHRGPVSGDRIGQGLQDRS